MVTVQNIYSGALMYFSYPCTVNTDEDRHIQFILVLEMSLSNSRIHSLTCIEILGMVFLCVLSYTRGVMPLVKLYKLFYCMIFHVAIEWSCRQTVEGPAPAPAS